MSLHRLKASLVTFIILGIRTSMGDGDDFLAVSKGGVDVVAVVVACKYKMRFIKSVDQLLM